MDLQQSEDTSKREPISLETNGSTSSSLGSMGSLGAAEMTDVGLSEEADVRRPAKHQPEAIKCSAVHALERDMPDEDYTHLVLQLRQLILDHHQANPGLYNQHDIDTCKHDDWHLSRFLLRHKLDLQLAFDMLKATLRFHNESLHSTLRPQDFPQEFYQLGGCFSYEPDRRHNQTLYLRVKVHRKTPEIAAVVHAFLTFQTLQCDRAARGRGMSIVIDCTGAGLQSADMDMLYYLIWMLRNFFPKGLSYILVHNLPWLLKPFWHIAKVWVPDEHRELVKFSNQKTIFEYIDKENLPDFMGGTCGRNYRAVPENCTSIAEAIKLWGIEKKIGLRILEKFADNLPEESVAHARQVLADCEPTGEPTGVPEVDTDSGNERDEADSYHSSNENDEPDETVAEATTPKDARKLRLV